MKIKKISAIVMIAAVLALSAPITGALPNPLGVTASAEEYKAGDQFWVSFDTETGKVTGEPEVLSEPSRNVFYRCTVLEDGTISVALDFWFEYGGADYEFRGNSITIPDKICGQIVTVIEGWSKGGFSSITIPDTVTTISENAFSNAFYLEEVKFGANSQLKTIGESAFWDCRSLKSISIPASVETIGTMAFANNADSRELKIKIREMGELSEVDFTNTYSLTDVKFAKGSKLKVIDQWAFQNQPKLTSVTLPDSLEKIGFGAFLCCSSFEEINVPKNVNEIGAHAFDCCSADQKTAILTKITVDKANTSFKSVDGVVYSKDGKTVVAYPNIRTGDKYEIPADVTKIAEGAFADCFNLTSVTVPEGITELPETAFYYATALKSITLPSTLKTIGDRAFEGTALTSLYIPESVTAIDAHAFDSTALKTITGKAGSYAETFAKENGYTFKDGTALEPDDTDTTNTFTDDSEDKAADVQVIAKPNVIPKEARFSVRLDDKNATKTRVAYNCFFTYNGAEYEPTETVTVKIPVPITMRDIADTLKVYHLQDGKYVNMSAKVVDGYLVFDTDHFSTYIVTAEELDKAGTPGGSDGANGGSSNANDNHNTGVALAIAPVLLAGAAALVALKKRK